MSRAPRLPLAALLAVGLLPAPSVHAQNADADEATRQQMIGTWVIPKDSVDYDGNPSRDVYRRDGTTSFYIYRDAGCHNVATTVDGTWDVRNGILTATITKSSDPKMFPVGMTARDQVMDLDTTHLTLRALPGNRKFTRERSEGCTPVDHSAEKIDHSSEHSFAPSGDD